MAHGVGEREAKGNIQFDGQSGGQRAKDTGGLSMFSSVIRLSEAQELQQIRRLQVWVKEELL